MNLKPIGERVIIKPEKKEEKTKGGIYIPENAKDEKKAGVVIAVGSLDSKKYDIKKGDRIVYGGYSSDEIELDGEKYIIIDAKDVLAKLE